MKRSLQDTLYLFLPGLMILLSISVFTMELLNTTYKIQGSLLAYSKCASEMIDYAFIGQVYNFTDCYIKEKSNTTFYCEYNKDEIICNVNGNIKRFPINQ